MCHQYFDGVGTDSDARKSWKVSSGKMDSGSLSSTCLFETYQFHSGLEEIIGLSGNIDKYATIVLPGNLPNPMRQRTGRHYQSGHHVGALRLANELLCQLCPASMQKFVIVGSGVGREMVRKIGLGKRLSQIKLGEKITFSRLTFLPRKWLSPEAFPCFA